jgi:hypothetical protein
MAANWEAKKNLPNKASAQTSGTFLNGFDRSHNMGSVHGGKMINVGQAKERKIKNNDFH